MRILMTLLLCLALAAGCTNMEKQGMTHGRQGRLTGYLASDMLPDSEALLPPPPAAGSTAFALDEDISRNSFALRGAARWNLAIEDADTGFPQAAQTFVCSLDAPVNEKDTPHLYTLMRRIVSDAGHSTSKAKKKYVRPRPFVVNKQPSCTPDFEEIMSKDGSYPSGHSSAGWAWALVLSELAPDRADAILARGRAYGQSRVVCNVHWESDVMEGRTMAAAVVAKLHADPAFRADMEAAREELAAVRARGLKPGRDCKAEADALALYPPHAPWPANK